MKIEEFSTKVSDILQNLSKGDTSLPIHLGIVESSPSLSPLSTLKVRIPAIDGNAEINAIPSAYPVFGYAGEGYGVYYPYSNLDIVVVLILDSQEFRLVLGKIYNAGEIPLALSDAGDKRSGKTIGVCTPSGHCISIVDAEGDNEMTIRTANGYQISLRDDPQLPNDEETNHSYTTKRGLTVETPSGNKIEFDEESDDGANHSLNIEIIGTRNDEASEAINVTLDPGGKVAANAPARAITVQATSEDGNGIYTATAVLDTKGNVAVDATGDINLSKANANIQITEDENSGKSQIKMNADEIFITADDIKLTGDVEVGAGKDLKVYNGAIPVVMNSHLHAVINLVNSPPPTSHTHLTNVSTPS